MSGILQQVDVTRPLDISLPVRSGQSIGGAITTFGLPFAAEAVLMVPRADGLQGVRCVSFNFCTHANCTHLESSAHIDPNYTSCLGDLVHVRPMVRAQLIHVKCEGKTISIADLANFEPQAEIEAVILATGWVAEKLATCTTRMDFSGNDPPALLPELVTTLRDMYPGLRYILVDLPSVDPEGDLGALLAHRAFWCDPDGSLCRDRFIIELCNIDVTIVPAGVYGLAINAAAFDSDAVPCRPVLYPLLAQYW